MPIIRNQFIIDRFGDPRHWGLTKKKKYSVWVCMPNLGTKVTNFLENANYITSKEKPFVIMGTAGETWVIDPRKLAATYQFPDGRPVTPEILRPMAVKYRNSACIDWFKLETKSGKTQPYNFAMLWPLCSENYPVQTSWGETLYANRSGIPHGKGDFIVCACTVNQTPDFADMWVVNGEIFPKTYDLRCFRNQFIGDAKASEMPKPRSIFV